MSGEQQRASRSFIAAARLDADESVFDQIAEARRLSVKVTEGEVPKDKPVIDSIKVEVHDLGD